MEVVRREEEREEKEKRRRRGGEKEEGRRMGGMCKRERVAGRKEGASDIKEGGMEGSGRNGGMEGAREEGGGALQTSDYVGNFLGRE